MKTIKATLISIIILICSIFILTVCTKDPKEKNDNNTPSPTQYIQEKTEISPLEYTNIIVKNGTLNNEAYSGTISNENITLIKLNDTTLTFLMPNLPVGLNSLLFTINNTNIQMDFTILQPPVFTNPKDYILNYEVVKS